MNFLGIGPFELLLILVIATIVLGPERMAQAGRTLGRLYAEYRRRWQKDVDEMTRELRRELATLQQELEEIRQTTEDEIKTAQAAWESAVDAQIDLDAATQDSIAQPDVPEPPPAPPAGAGEPNDANAEPSPGTDERPAQAPGSTATKTETDEVER